MINLHGISRRSFDDIVGYEVTSEVLYNKRYRWPTWPGEQSGVTIGVGYDVGQQSKAQFLADWSGRIPVAMLNALAKTCGVTGPAAKPLADRLRGVVDIPWAVALEVFSEHDVPRYLDICRGALPGFDELSPDCKGSILSIVFNRGASFGKAGPRYAEMRGIKAAMKSGDLAQIPALIRSMKRLWPAGSGLRPRRDREAALFEQGLASTHAHLLPEIEAVPEIPDPDMVAKVQQQLRDQGFYAVGAIDGSLAPKGKTEDAILAFRNRHGLPLTPTIDDEFLTVLAKAAPIEVAEERATATVQDLREQQSETIGITDKVKGWAGKIVGGGSGLGAAGSLALVTEKATQVTDARNAIGAIGLSAQAWWIIAAIVLVVAVFAGAGLMVWWVADKIERKRLVDYRSGKNP